MTRPFDDLTELRTLLEALCEETITAEQTRRLEELVLARPEAEAYYVQYMSLQADLVSRFGALPAPTEQSLRDRLRAAPAPQPGGPGSREGKPVSARARLARSPRLFLALAALAAGLLFLLVLGRRPHSIPVAPDPVPEAIDNTVAVLLQAPGAEWDEAGLPVRAGAPLPPGRLRLKAGFAQIEFYCGATVILEGPADLELISRTEAFCARGKLRATVPPTAQGFTIGSPDLDLVDRGTEFGLQVGTGHRTEVHVFRGKVDLYDPGAPHEAPRRELTTGQGVCLDGPGNVRPIGLNPAAFQTAESLAARSQKETELRQQKWREACEELRRDPSLLVYYTFQPGQPWSRTLPDQTDGRRSPHDGAIVGCAWGAGRWPGKQGLEFKRVSDRVRLTVPGEFASLTLVAWVRVDGLPNLNNSLLMTDAWQEGKPHWQIGDSGKLILGVQSRPKGHGAHYHALNVLTPERLGQWLQLAVVYDRDAGQVTHYVDGQPVAQDPLVFDIPLRIGDAELGNWNIASHHNPSPVRHFTGCMDEFLMFSRALADREIERLYTQGRPPS
jgi:hypothetical protein